MTKMFHFRSMSLPRLKNWCLWPVVLAAQGQPAGVERAFYCREGLRRKDDRFPPRFLHEKIPSGNSRGLKIKPEELQEMLDEYYALRGWDTDGLPKRETLNALGLGNLII